MEKFTKKKKKYITVTFARDKYLCTSDCDSSVETSIKLFTFVSQIRQINCDILHIIL